MGISIETTVDEIKRVITCLVPFGVWTPIGGRIMRKNNPRWDETIHSNKDMAFSRKRNLAYILLAGTISGLSPFYGVAALDNGTLNCSRWSEIHKQRREERIARRDDYERAVLDKAYIYFDSNLDGEITAEEFKKGIDAAEGHIHDALNFDLGLGEEYVKTVKGRKT